MTEITPTHPTGERLRQLEASVEALHRRNRRVTSGALLLIVAALTMGQVQVQTADLEIHENPDGGAAGSDSYELKLIGRVTGPADRAMIIQNMAESGTDDYRLSIQNNGGTEIISVDDDGGLSLGPVDGGGSNGTLTFYDDDASAPESMTLQPPSNWSANFTMTLPVDDGVDGEFLRTDGSGTLTWSGGVTQAISTSDATTSSTSDVLLTTMTITPGAGDYMVWFSTSAQSTEETEVYFSLYVGGVQVAHTERRFEAESSIANTSFPVAFQAYVTSVGASDAIEVRWRLASGAETGTCHERTLTIMKL